MTRFGVILTWLGSLGLTAAQEVELTYEVFSLPMPEAAALARGKHGGEEAYRRVLKRVEEKRARQEEFSIVKIASGSLSETRQVEQMIYPTESYFPWQSFRPAFAEQEARSRKRKALSPQAKLGAAWDHKLVGMSFDTGARKLRDRWYVETSTVKIGFTQRDQIGRGVGMVEMPRFSIQSLQTSVWVSEGKPVLLGTLSPPRQLQEQEGQERRVWLIFLTARESG